MTGEGRPTILLVALREIRTRLRSRAFMLGTGAMVALIAAGMVAWTLLAAPGGTSGTSVERVGFTGAATTLEPVFTSAATTAGTQVAVSDVTDVAAGTAQVTAGQLEVLVTGAPTAPTAIVVGTLPSDIEAALDVAVLEARLGAVGVPSATVTDVVNGTNVAVQSVAPATPVDPNRDAEITSAIALAILLYVTIGAYGGFVAQGVVEEKSTRIVEILLATIRPSQLLAGKVIGVGLVGLLQLAIVAAATLILAALTHVAAIPAVSPPAVLGDLVWFLLGFLFYATAFAAVASTVSRQEEVTSAIAPVTVLLLGSYLLMFVVVTDPASPTSTVLSLLPPFTPVLMSARIATGAAVAWQVLLSLALMVVSIGGLMGLAGRIYANSVLRVGKRVRLGDAFRGRSGTNAE
jgi:ABC-2 type transport system permease protein